MRKIGIMGGTFNPIHNGHLKIAEEAYLQYGLEKVWFLPAKKPPHKKNKKLTSNQERMDMVRLAIAPYSFFSISSIEMEREGYSYTADTLAYFHKTDPKTDWYFIIGADSLHYLDEWYKPEVIFQLAHILCAPRYPMTEEEDYRCRDYLIEKYNGSIDFIKMKPIRVASRDIVKKLKNNDDVAADLPAGVYQYIVEKQLYAV